MKKIIIALIMILMLTLTACGGGNAESSDAETSGNNAGVFGGGKSVQGEWTDTYDTLITIEGDSVLVERMGDSHIGSVDESAKTITIKDGLHDDGYQVTGDAVFEYQIVKDKLVLTQIESEDWNCLGLEKTYSYQHYVPKEESEETESTEEA